MPLIAKNRWQAFAWHLLCSLLIFIVLASIIYFLWYPGFLFFHDGGVEGMKLIAGVDFIIGPVLTLMVYKVGKKTLKFDLTCIVLLQLGCIAGGMWAVWQTRPVALVFAAGSYATLNKQAYEAQGYEPGKIEILQGRWPKWLAVNLPEGAEGGISAVWALTGENLHANIENYVRYEEMIPTLSRQGLQAADIKDAQEVFENFQKKHATAKFFPVTTSMHSGYLAIDTATGKVLRYFDEPEWKPSK
jgi:hypothetical protein